MTVQRRLATVLLAFVFLAGCSSGHPGEITVTKVQSDPVRYASLQEFLAAVPMIITGAVTDTVTIAKEVPPPNGGGRDLYGKITFQPIDLLKGDPPTGGLTVEFASGKRHDDNGPDYTGYQVDRLEAFQLADSTLLPVTAFAGRSYIVFATPAPRPVISEGFTCLVVAEVLGGGQLKFPQNGSPVHTQGQPVTISLDDIKAALNYQPKQPSR
ncbi:hypothetical protein [Dactylosporangium sp. CA-233914]|uniref:hypothetical protein n=1 Tax=Dactylosporangium sp. CA-233914 TaxID=3239934 RepID=UPI003D943600